MSATDRLPAFDRDFVPVAVRAHAVRPSAKQKKRRRGAMRRAPIPPSYVLAIDTETTTDLAQRLNIGGWQYYRVEWEKRRYPRLKAAPAEEPPFMTLLDQGVFYADDLPERDPKRMAILRAYVEERNGLGAIRDDGLPRVSRQHCLASFAELRLLSRDEFERKVWRRAVEEARAVVATFNFGFDISRIAVGYGASNSGLTAGGFTFSLACHPDGNVNNYPHRLAVKHLTPTKAFKELRAGLDGFRFGGRLLDLRTLVYALSNQAHTLESACHAFGIPYTKRKVKHGWISPKYVTYLREDVTATARLWQATMTEFRRLELALEAEQAYSGASIGKAHLRKIGISPLRERGITDRVNGYASTAYFGGRAECRIRHAPVPVRPLDFRSQYPTVCSLLHLWDLLIAEQIEVREQSAAALTKWLDGIGLDQCFDKRTWPKLRAIALVQPDGDCLPVRARYSDGGSQWRVAVSDYMARNECWYTLPDLVASKILTGRTPRILKVIRFVPVGRLPSLSPLRLRGEVYVDPRKRDLFRAAVEARRIHERKLEAQGLTPKEVNADPLVNFLKVLSNATSYGIFVQANRRDEISRETVTVHGLDTFEADVTAPEEPGEYYCAPIAALITGGGRLLLAMLERCVTTLGGTFLATDTDSMAVVVSRDGGLVPCPGGPYRDDEEREAVRALSWKQVGAIVDRFASLNPYNRSIVRGSILGIEKENYDRDGQERELWGFTISAKRYAYYTYDEGADLVELVKCSEHGLGHYLDPTDPGSERPIGERPWIREAWEWIIRTKALGQDAPEPVWLNRPALRKHAISAPRYLRALESLHPGLSYQEQVKPFGFMAIATPISRVDLPEPFALVQPLSTDQRDWAERPWINVHDGPGRQRYRIGYTDEESWIARRMSPIDEADFGDTGIKLFREPRTVKLRKGEKVIAVQRFRDVLDRYVSNPEVTQAGPDGRSCSWETRGLLHRRKIALATLTAVGKEGNQFQEPGLYLSAADTQLEYHPRSAPSEWQLVCDVLHPLPDARLAELAGLDRGTVADARKGKRLRKSTRAALTRAAVELVNEWIREQGIRPLPVRRESRLALYLELCKAGCPICRKPLPSGRAIYCSDACRQRAHRARSAAAA